MSEIDSGVFLTTYSTLASTLAGAFGFLVAVVLYVMQGINTHIGNCAAALVANSPADRNKLQQLRSSGKWDEMIRLHAQAGQHNPARPAEINRETDEQFQEMRRALARFGVVRHELSRAMYMTGFVILASIINMPLTEFILIRESVLFSGSPSAAVTILTLTIIAAMFCIRGYFKLMMAVLES
ncbi:MAG: hypothetical protein ACT4QC_16895 [Planctomycetaceae bacterium]